jgi:hypothetical protein
MCMVLHNETGQWSFHVNDNKAVHAVTNARVAATEMRTVCDAIP